MKNNKLIVVLGPTASGKTELSVKLAKKFSGEIISADSRQIYNGLNIGSGKITKKEMEGIPHHLLNIANPKRKFSVSQYQKFAFKKIKEIQKSNKIPFLVGGTGFYIQSIVDGLVIPEVKPDWNLRNKLEEKSTQELFLMLKKLDPRRIQSIDKNNPRRLIRALEIVLKTQKPISPLLPVGPVDFEILQIGIKKSPQELKKLIRKRLLKRLNQGMVNEVKKLKKSGVSFERLEEFGLEYRFVAQYIQNKLTYKDMIGRLQKEIEHFAKRQRTWFKRDNRIIWITNYVEAFKIVKNFLNKKHLKGAK